MPYDPLLAERLRQALKTIYGVKENFKFGGPSFSINDTVFIRAHHDGNIMQRCKKERTDELLKLSGVKPLAMKGKAVQGWLIVDSELIRTDEDLNFWIEVAMYSIEEAKPTTKRKRKSQ
ncbi:hypothetical protein MUY27_16450 [Mucilaginibacter sp. RS28]|uniref:TfoX N-terminal domain-containing protein n=1 Tax=Mucilaginibacter straminoryzae TaxID=2932774 RepID=A0A9X1X677_9SPHI|nr:hypothetical protein [Mucilaginibacter straminoryzae]MCJ8211311.1 hypothetical protein [Mucilaginibacter straminoryzae]